MELLIGFFFNVIQIAVLVHPFRFWTRFIKKKNTRETRGGRILVTDRNLLNPTASVLNLGSTDPWGAWIDFRGGGVRELGLVGRD